MTTNKIYNKLLLNSDDLFSWLKVESEKFWKNIKVDSKIYGFQIQPGTKWMEGLKSDQINKFEKDLGFDFPEIYKIFLRHMNGTDKPAINVYGESGEPCRFAPGYYSYPRDIKIIKAMIENEYQNGFKVGDQKNLKIPHIIPIVSHRFLVADRCDTNPILSMLDWDIILYADSLKKFLINDIFLNHKFQEDLPDIKVKWWFEG
jgi:hypothetical protein